MCREFVRTDSSIEDQRLSITVSSLRCYYTVNFSTVSYKPPNVIYCPPKQSLFSATIILNNLLYIRGHKIVTKIENQRFWINQLLWNSPHHLSSILYSISQVSMFEIVARSLQICRILIHGGNIFSCCYIYSSISTLGSFVAAGHRHIYKNNAKNK